MILADLISECVAPRHRFVADNSPRLPPGRPNGYPVQSNTHTHIISGPGMLDTSSQYTHAHYDNTLSASSYAQQSLSLPRLPLPHASSSPRFDTSSAHHWNSPPLIQTVDSIQPYVSNGLPYERHAGHSRSEMGIVRPGRQSLGRDFIAYARV